MLFRIGCRGHAAGLQDLLEFRHQVSYLHFQSASHSYEEFQESLDPPAPSVARFSFHREGGVMRLGLQFNSMVEIHQIAKAQRGAWMWIKGAALS